MISVRKSKYRGKAGWLVCGHRTRERTGWPVSIFCEHESAARRIAAKVKAGEEVTLEDYEP